MNIVLAVNILGRILLQEDTAVAGGYPNYIIPILLSLAFGALGGIVFELLRLRGSLEMPHRYNPAEEENDIAYLEEANANRNRLFDLGVFARIFVGGMAALAILLVITPADPIKLIAAAIIAGSAGASIFDALRTRLTATLAIADAADVRNKSVQLQERLDDMEGLIQQLNAQARATTDNAEGLMEGAKGLDMLASTIDPTLLDQLSLTLGEAKGIRASMQRGVD